MAPAGLEKIEAAKSDGSWKKLDFVEPLSIPPDVKEAFASSDKAEKYFDEFPSSVKRRILE